MKEKYNYLYKILLLAITLFFIPNTLFANMIWPAIYVIVSYERFWFLIIITIIIELLSIKYFLQINYIKSLKISLVANIVSATIGLWGSAISLLFWHLIADEILGNTFNLFNEIATIILMFLLSVFIEVLTIKIIWNFQTKKIIQSISIGNILTYTIIAIYLFKFGGWDMNL